MFTVSNFEMPHGFTILTVIAGIPHTYGLNQGREHY